MRSARFVSWFVVILAISCSVILAKPALHRGETDALSGEWVGTFHAKGQSAELTLNLKVEGHQVTGTVTSAHTGPSTISKGSWENNKLSMTFDFAKHESIIVTGTLKDGKLSGEFRTEGFVDQWEATRKSDAH